MPAPLSVVSTQQRTRKMGGYVVGIDGGTESIRAGIFDEAGTPVAMASSEYPTHFPWSGWAEQQPNDWWDGLGKAVKKVVALSGVSPEHINAIALTTTCCTVVALDAKGDPIRPCLLWMDMRSSEQAEQVLATGDPALSVNSGGAGPVSSEWMVPKALWLKQKDPEVYERARYICEYQDFMNFRLTGCMVASVNNASIRWHYSTKTGWPTSLLQKLGLEDLKEKWPQDVLGLGEVVGGLTQEAAQHLGLIEGLPVAQGGADAFVGMVGLGVVRAGELALLTGSSHLHLGMTDRHLQGRGMWGTYPDAVLPGLGVVEGGQTSTGSVIAWFRRLLSSNNKDSMVSYGDLNREAEAVPIGAEGLVCLDHFQGNRTPFTDPLSRGAIGGLSLKHDRGHIFRALIEGVCMGTEAVFEAMRAAGYTPESIAVAGGATRSKLWLQTHADVSNVPLRLTKVPDACLLGAAVLAAAGAGMFESIRAAVDAMVHVERTVLPDPESHLAYRELQKKYNLLYPALKPVFHESKNNASNEKSGEGGVTRELEEADIALFGGNNIDVTGNFLPSGIVNASILAADLANLKGEVSTALEAGVDWIHVDVVDNQFAKVLTFGPPVVASLHRHHPSCFLDVHLAVERPEEYIPHLKEAGASQVLFHPEPLPGGLNKAAALAGKIRSAGMRAGVALKPETPVSAVMPLLVPVRLLHCVDVLAVQPGFGGQVLDPRVLDKVRELRSACPQLDIQVDGGLNASTISDCVTAGANVLTAGSFLFGGGEAGMMQGVSAMRAALVERWS